MKLKEKIVLTIKPRDNLPNKMHIDAQIRFPARIQENRKKYNRARQKASFDKYGY